MSNFKLIEFANSTDPNEPAYYELPQSSSDISVWYNLDEFGWNAFWQFADRNFDGICFFGWKDFILLRAANSARSWSFHESLKIDEHLANTLPELVDNKSDGKSYKQTQEIWLKCLLCRKNPETFMTYTWNSIAPFRQHAITQCHHNNIVSTWKHSLCGIYKMKTGTVLKLEIKWTRMNEILSNQHPTHWQSLGWYPYRKEYAPGARTNMPWVPSWPLKPTEDFQLTQLHSIQCFKLCHPATKKQQHSNKKTNT